MLQPSLPRNSITSCFSRVMLHGHLATAIHNVASCCSRVMLPGHPAAALTAMKWYLMLFLQSDAREVRRRAAQKAPRSNNSPTKGLLTSPGDRCTAKLSLRVHDNKTIVHALDCYASCAALALIKHKYNSRCTAPLGNTSAFMLLSVRQLPWSDSKPEAVPYHMYLIIWCKDLHIPPLTQGAWSPGMSKHDLLL